MTVKCTTNAPVGFALLDREWGRAWVNGIDLDKFNIRDPYNCIVGQLHGGEYATGIDVLSDAVRPGYHDPEWDAYINARSKFAFDHGFDSVGYDPETRYSHFVPESSLQDDWVALIRERLAELS
jgi:hypothetical protein